MDADERFDALYQAHATAVLKMIVVDDGYIKLVHWPSAYRCK